MAGNVLHVGEKSTGEALKVGILRAFYMPIYWQLDDMKYTQDSNGVFKSKMTVY